MFKDALNMCSLIFSRAVRTIKPTEGLSQEAV